MLNVYTYKITSLITIVIVVTKICRLIKFRIVIDENNKKNLNFVV